MADGTQSHTCSVCGAALGAEDTWEIDGAYFCETHARRFIYAEDNDLATKTWVNTKTTVIVHLESDMTADYTFDQISSFIGSREIVLCYQDAYYQLFSHSDSYIQFISTFTTNGAVDCIFITLYNNNAWGIDNQVYSINNKYDKTGGRIDGDASITQNHSFEIVAEEEGTVEEGDYYKDSVVMTAVESNWGPTLNLVSRQQSYSIEETTCRIAGVQTPRQNNDAATKKYVDDSIKLPKYYSLTLNDDRTIETSMSNAYSIISQDLINGYEVYLKVWYKDNYFICPLSGYHAETHGWITFDGVCILDGERWQPSIWVNQQNVWHVEDKVDEITKNWVMDQFGAHTIWEVENPRANGIGYTSGKMRDISNWSLTNLNLTDYKYVLAYVQGCNGDVRDQEGVSLVIRIDLDGRFRTPRTGYYAGSLLGYAPCDNGVKAGAIIIIDDTKTKCCMIYSNFNTTGTTALERDYKLYKLEGYKN